MVRPASIESPGLQLARYRQDLPPGGRYGIGIDAGQHSGVALVRQGLEGRLEVLVARAVVGSGPTSRVWHTRAVEAWEAVAAELRRRRAPPGAVLARGEAPSRQRRTGRAPAYTPATWVGLGAYLGRHEALCAQHVGRYPVRVAVQAWWEQWGIRGASKDLLVRLALRLGGASAALDQVAEVDREHVAEAILIAGSAILELMPPRPHLLRITVAVEGW